ncbi:class I SAM-dependent methyltransferase [Streptomyces sp. R35]|uniref:Class I SAM-dependent methyltransferase n=1 Tax=Streptomyces sp. R35 TaxID=3238630 RepID=A0AB39S7P8_9ACTN
MPEPESEPAPELPTVASTVARFYDQLAADYHLIYADWDASISRQGRALDALIQTELGIDGASAGASTGASVLDCSCGIGTQAIGLGLQGHRVTGTDISVSAVRRAVGEATLRGVRLPAAAADMRRLPFPDDRFDVVVSADNALPHLLTAEDVRTALTEMRRVLRAGGLLILSTRPYDEILRARPTSTPPQVSSSPQGRTITFQLWDWHEDGERYDLEHFQLVPDGEGAEGAEPGESWQVRVRRTTYWALTQRQLTSFAAESGFIDPRWMPPENTGFFQPILTARAG